MQEKYEEILYKDKKYKLICNLNVMESIQAEYNSFTEWGLLCSGSEAGNEPDIKAIKFGFELMINEGLEVESEENGTTFEKITSKKVGRIISEIGLLKSAELLARVITQSVGAPQEKNVLSTKTKTR